MLEIGDWMAVLSCIENDRSLFSNVVQRGKIMFANSEYKSEDNWVYTIWARGWVYCQNCVGLYYEHIFWVSKHYFSALLHKKGYGRCLSSKKYMNIYHCLNFRGKPEFFRGLDESGRLTWSSLSNATKQDILSNIFVANFFIQVSQQNAGFFVCFSL